MTTSRRSLGNLLGAPLQGLLRGLRWLLPGRRSARALHQSAQVTDDLRLELGKAIASRHLASKRLAELELRHSELRRQIETALDAGREDLARAGIADELQTETQTDVCRRTMREATILARDLEQALGALLRARRDFARSVSDENSEPGSRPTTWGEEPTAAPLPSSKPLTYERRVQERLLDIKSRRRQPQEKP